MLTKPTPRFIAIQSSYWACYCCIISFSSVYLLDKGFSNAQVGLVISVGGLLSAIIQPRVSRAADRLRKLSLRLFCAGVAGIALVASACLLFLPGKLPQLVLYGSLVVLVQLLMPLCSALGMACLNLGYQLNFGIARGAGSIAFGVFSALCGRLVLWLGAWSVAAAMLAMQAVLFIAILSFRFQTPAPGFVPPEPKPEATPKQKGQAFLRAYPHMIFVLLASCLVFLSHNLLNTFEFQIVQHLGGDSGSMGTVLFLQSILELPVMFGFSWLLTKATSRVWTRISGVGFFFHALGSWLAPTIGVLCAVQVFEMNGYALFAIASIYYINETVAEDRRVEGQSWFTMSTTLGSVLSGLVGGNLLDLAGAPALLGASTIAGGVGMVLFWVFLRPAKQAKGGSA